MWTFQTLGMYLVSNGTAKRLWRISTNFEVWEALNIWSLHQYYVGISDD